MNEWSYVSILLRINAMRKDINIFKKKFLIGIPHTIMWPKWVPNHSMGSTLC